jgi:hypothetical protein
LEPVETRFPLLETNTKDLNAKNIIEQEWGIKLPRMYELGFSHANCGGRCVRGGYNHYADLLRVWPNKYKQQEEMEERMRELLGNVSILKNRNGGKSFTLREYREELEKGITNHSADDGDDTIPCVCVFS